MMMRWMVLDPNPGGTKVTQLEGKRKDDQVRMALRKETKGRPYLLNHHTRSAPNKPEAAASSEISYPACLDPTSRQKSLNQCARIVACLSPALSENGHRVIKSNDYKKKNIILK